MTGNEFGFTIVLVIALGIALLVYALVRRSLHILLDETIKIPAGTVFYTRVLLIGLVFVALYATLAPFKLAENAAFMEYVWQVASEISSALGWLCLFVAVYLVVITIVVAALRRRND